MDRMLKNPGYAAKRKEGLVPGTGTLRVPGTSSSACHQGFSLNRRGQQVIEYAVVVAAIAAAFTTMYVFMQRGLQAHIKILSDSEIGPQNECFPLSRPGEEQVANSTISTLSSDTMRANKTYGDARYEFEMVSATTGNSLAVFNATK